MFLFTERRNCLEADFHGEKTFSSTHERRQVVKVIRRKQVAKTKQKDLQFCLT